MLPELFFQTGRDDFSLSVFTLRARHGGAGCPSRKSFSSSWRLPRSARHPHRNSLASRCGWMLSPSRAFLPSAEISKGFSSMWNPQRTQDGKHGIAHQDINFPPAKLEGARLYPETWLRLLDTLMDPKKAFWSKIFLQPAPTRPVRPQGRTRQGRTRKASVASSKA